MSNASLSAANLSAANLSAANLSAANLSPANLSPANLSPENSMSDICTQLHTYIDEKYNHIFATYTRNISSDISNDEFTKNYGEISQIIETHFKSITLDCLPSNRWYIHYIIHSKAYATNQSQCTVNVYDNYGDTYTFQWIRYSIGYGDDTIYKNIETINKYPLPNALINFVKTFSDVTISASQLEILGEFYHNNFMKYKDLYQTGKLIDYSDLLNKHQILSEENNKLKIDIEDASTKLVATQADINSMNVAHQTQIDELNNRIKETDAIYIDTLQQRNTDINILVGIEMKYVKLKEKHHAITDKYLRIIEKLTKENRSLRKQLASDVDYSDIDTDTNTDPDPDSDTDFRTVLSK
jgi:hypothetical protein